MTVKKAYKIALKVSSNKFIISILDFGDSFGFLFGRTKTDIVFGGHYILVNKTTGEISSLPTTPQTRIKFKSSKNIKISAVI